MASSPRNENDDVEQGLAASPPSTQNAASSRRFTASSTQTQTNPNPPPANATTTRTMPRVGISPTDAAAADYAAMAPSAAATMHATAPSAVSELTRAWTGSTADNAATFPSVGPGIIDNGDEPPSPTGKMEAMMDDPPAKSASAAAMPPPPPAGLEQVHDYVGPLPPVAMTDAATMDEDAAIKRRVGGAKAAGMEQMHDYVGPLPPVAMTDAATMDKDATIKRGVGGAKTSGLELMPPPPSFGLAEIVNDNGPSPPVGMTAAATMDEDAIVKRRVGGGKTLGMEQIHDAAGPLPPTAAEGGAADSYLKKSAMSNNTAASVGTAPFNSVGIDEAGQPTLPPNTAARGTADFSGTRLNSPSELMPPTTLYPPINNNDDEHNRIDPDDADAIVNRVNTNEIIQASVRPILQPGPDNDSTPFIPEAVLVADGDDQVIIATPLEPWLKQRRTKLFLSLICLLVTIFAIVFGVERSKNRSATSSPSFPPTASSPSFLPSTAPSSSLSPSSLPSSCGYKLSSNKQEIDLRLGESFSPQMAVDGRNMVVVARDLISSTTYTNFYSLENDEWIIRNAFQEDYSSDSMYYRVALSGKRAMVGIQEAGVSAYQQNQQGFWQNVEEPFIQEEPSIGNLGFAVGLDGDLACVGDADYIHLFRRDGNKWVQFDRIDFKWGACSIAGDNIAIGSERSALMMLYKYDEDQGKAVPLQDPIPTGGVSSMALSHDYLVYSAVGEEFIIYRREEKNQTFTPHQQFNISGPKYRNRLALDQDILVIHGENHTHIFSEQNGYWDETITLDQSFWPIQLSGRTLLAASLNDVYSFNIEGCAPMPTQMPTTSMAPTTCYLVEITIAYDKHPWETSWKLQRTGANGDDSAIKFYKEAADGDTSYTESLCLQEGEYEFIMYDSLGNGICCHYVGGEGHYNVTSNGALIAEGGDFERREATRFSLPFFPAAPSTVPSISQTPSSSLSPSMSWSPSTTPSSSSSPSTSQLPSSSPTEPCFYIEINVFSDDDPSETQWVISTIVTVDGIQEENFAYDSSQVELQVDGKLYTAAHIENSATENSVNGVLCDCGRGTSQCECEGEVCFIERGDNKFHEKVANCEDAGGVAAIIYNNVEESIFSKDWILTDISANIPAAFISQLDGQYLVERGLGKVVAMTTSNSFQFNANTLNSRRICLPEGEYEFAIYDSDGDGIDLPGHYNVTSSNGALIAQGRDFGSEETTRFSLPFMPMATWTPTFTGNTPPTRPPSSSPSAKMTPMPTQMVSSSIAPTTCYLIDVSIIYDWAPVQSSWTLQRISAFGDSALVQTYVEASWTVRSYTESMCLPAGEYEFTIYDSEGDGICCDWGEGKYNITSVGELIAQGGDFEDKETTIFSLPYTLAT